MLTAKQIEIERALYEAYRRKQLGRAWCGARDEHGIYMDIVNFSGFNAWLARAELGQLVKHVEHEQPARRTSDLKICLGEPLPEFKQE